MVTSVKGGLSSNPDVIDIDADHKELRLCSVYAPDIYSNFRVAEVCIVDAFLLFVQYRFSFYHCQLLYLRFVKLRLS